MTGLVKIIPTEALGQDVNAVNSLGETPLHFAAKSGNKTACEFLLENGANRSATTNQGTVR